MSNRSFLSPLWYRLSALRPALKQQARIRRHRYRGDVWYVVQDPASGRFHRFTPAAYQVLGLLDGRRTMDEVWRLAIDELGDDLPSQEELIQLLSQLHAADLLQCEATPDATELFDRFARTERTRHPGRWKNPMSIKFPLWDPDDFLVRTLQRVRPLLGWPGVLLYCLVVGAGIALGAQHWAELSGNISDQVLSANNLLLMAICFPVVKLLHELGHAYATKLEGGEVHEMGVLLLIFMPVPYVDASAAAGFRSKWRRALVGAAGMITELFVAALCMMLWVAAEPGWLRALAYNVVLIAGISTVVFNGNPLLRYDGYFILSDLLEIPNLAQRGTQYWRYLLERHVLRLKDSEPPQLAPGERFWFIVYSPIALVYRTLVLVAIVLLVAGEWFVIGVALALWGMVTMFGMPLARLIGYLGALNRQDRSRQRAFRLILMVVAALVLVVLYLPMPSRLMAEGVIWLPEQAAVRAGADGFVRTVLVAPGAEVEPGTPLVQCEDPLLEAQMRVQEGRIAELEARLNEQRFADRVKASLLERELERERALLQRQLERAGLLTISSNVAGRVMIERPGDLPGRHVKKGQLIGHVVHHDDPAIVRAVVLQDDVELVRSRLEYAEVRLAERMDNVVRAALVREVPAARDTLPSAALSSQGGGTHAADPRDPRGERSLSTTFQYDLELPHDLPAAAFGGRVHVRLVHRPEPLADQWYRRLRQMFLARFNV